MSDRLLVLVLASISLSIPARAQITSAQATSKDCGPVTSCNLAFSANNASGNLVVVANGHIRSDVAFEGVLPAYTNLTNNFTTPQNVDGTAFFKAPESYMSITRYGARSVNPNVPPQTASVTATITLGSPTTVHINTASTFQNNDGVVIYGAGPSCPLTTPAAPKVTSVTAAAGTGTGLDVAGPTGSTVYRYAVVPISQDFCYPAASAVGSLTTGPASLGPQTVSLTSCSRSAAVATCTTATAHTLTVGTEVYVTGTSDNTNFGGHFTVDTVPDNTHFTFTNGIDATNGTGLAATGGSAKWYQAAHIVTPQVNGAWEYCFYRTSSPAGFIGCGRPQSASGTTDLTYDDYGSTMMANMTLPAWLPRTPPGSGQARALSTTITSGAGTTTLKLAKAASTAVAGQFIRFDDGVTIAAAAVAARASGSPLEIPLGTYVINYPVTLPSLIGIMQQGSLILNATVTMQSVTVWVGSLFPVSGLGLPSFAQYPAAAVSANEAVPGVYSDNAGGIWIEGLAFASIGAGNGGNPLFLNVATPFTVKKSTFVTGTSTSDTMGTGLIFRGSNGAGNANFNTITDSLFSGGPAGVSGSSETPQVFCTNIGYLRMDNVNFSLRSVLIVPAQASMDFSLNGGRDQGGIMPVVTTYNNSGLIGMRMLFTNFQEDTMGHAILANGLGGGIQSQVVIQTTGTPGADAGTVPGLVTGRPVNSLIPLMSYGPLGQNVNMFSPLLSTANFTNKSVQVNGMTGSVGFSMTPPAAPGLVVSAGGSVPVGTWTYVIYAVDANGNLSGPSVGAQVTTTTGNQTVTIAPPAAPLGSGAYAAARSSGGGFGLVNVANTAWTANIVDTFIFTNALPGSIGTALQAGINNTNLQTPQLVLTGGGFKNTQSFSGTGNRTTTYPDGNSATTLTTSFTTTAAASDNLSVQGATGSSHCSITPTNASAAADSPGTFISAKTTNQLTVTHPANAGRTWDIMCTAN